MKAEPPDPSRPLDLRLALRVLGYTNQAARTRNVLFGLAALRSVQLPLLAWAIGAVINGPITERNPGKLVLAVAGFAFLAALTDLVFHFRIKQALSFGEQVVSLLRRDVFAHMLRMPMAFFHENPAGSLISRLTSDIEAVRVGVQDALFISIVQGGQMTVAALLMLFYEPVLFLIIVAVGPVIWGLNVAFRRRQSRLFRATQESFSQVTANVAEAVEGIRVTQGFSRQRENAGIFRRLVESLSEHNIGAARNTAVFVPLLELNAQFFTAALLVAGGWRALNPSVGMPIGDLVMFMLLANFFFQPFQVLGNQFSQALAGLAGAERVFKVLDSEPSRIDEPPDALRPAEIAGRVEFRDVSFGYVPGKPVLRDVSFTVGAGRTIALVGHTGSGKTTIVSLVAKFYLPDTGEVLVDGISTRRLSSEALRRRLGMVTQQNFLFTGTILDNIRLARPEVPRDEVLQVIERLGCRREIEAAGLDTVVGEQGGGISLGQRQLVCIARAMLADPRILLLDEATSAVDSLTEMKIQNALSELLRNRTSFVIAHRLSTVRNADCVLVLDHGRIVERGTHDELLKADGSYAAMYRRFLDTPP